MRASEDGRETWGWWRELGSRSKGLKLKGSFGVLPQKEAQTLISRPHPNEGCWTMTSEHSSHWCCNTVSAESLTSDLWILTFSVVDKPPVDAAGCWELVSKTALKRKNARDTRTEKPNVRTLLYICGHSSPGNRAFEGRRSEWLLQKGESESFSSFSFGQGFRLSAAVGWKRALLKER